METVTNQKMETNVREEEKGKRKWGSRIYTFLASGGILIVLVVGFIIAVIIIGKLS